MISKDERVGNEHTLCFVGQMEDVEGESEAVDSPPMGSNSE